MRWWSNCALESHTAKKTCCEKNRVGYNAVFPNLIRGLQLKNNSVRMQKGQVEEDRWEVLEDEVLIVRNSGEIPEVAFHGSIYYLTEDPDGPELTLTNDNLRLLKKQVIARYQEIVLRDLIPENRDKSIYRGVKRSIANWRRLLKFCEREKQNIAAFRKEVAQALVNFLHQEKSEVSAGLRDSCINCTATELLHFARKLQLSTEMLPESWQSLCLYR